MDRLSSRLRSTQHDVAAVIRLSHADETVSRKLCVIFTTEQAEGEKLRLSAAPPAMLGLPAPSARTAIASRNRAIYTASSVQESLTQEEEEEEDENNHARRRPWVVSKERSSTMKLLQSELAAVPDDDGAWCARGAAGGARASRVPAAAVVSQLGVVQVTRAEIDLGRRKTQAKMESICRDAAPAVTFSYDWC